MKACPKNIRTRLALWYAVILGVILAGCAVTVVTVFSHGLREEFDRNLKEHFERANRHLEKAPSGQIGLRKPERAAQNPQRDFAEAVPVQVLDEAGSLLYQSPAWEHAELSKVPLITSIGAEQQIFSFRNPTAARFRLMHGPAHLENSKLRLRVALSEERVWKEIRELILVFVILFPIGMLSAGLAGYWMASKALRPVEQISRQAEAISAENLKERLRVANPDDELGLLARVINRLLERLEKSFDELKRFTSDASHELRTPLQALRSLGEVALQKDQETRYYRDVISSMLEETDRMSRLTHSLLTLSRADSGNYRLQKTPTSLQVLVGEIRSLIGILAEEKGQKLNIQVDSSLEANVDPLIFRQAVVNLVDNAIKYSPQGAEILVRLASNGVGQAIVEVRDQGSGVSKEHQQRIFDRFYRVDKSRSRDLGGSGLGLSIAKWAVEAHGGKIELDSLPDYGSTFRIILPVS